ncbi:MAG: hypothetical protein EHM58_04935 [Ignavibacteriae bacterium]|nr:MAG: hypothetical protein EHM58_04935 [Ignavibacteriota bacterium]
MAFESEKIMFEIYRDTLYNQNFRVVYYTELNEHNKHEEINRAMSGEHYYDGFIKDYKKEEAKQIIQNIINDLNEGKSVAPGEIKEMLKNYIP